LPRFEERLSRFLMQEKGDALISATGKRLVSLIAEAESSIELEAKAVALPLQELKEKTEAFKQNAASIVQEGEDTELLLRGEIARLLARVEDDLRAFAEENLPILLRRINAAYERHKHLTKKKLVEALNRELEASVKDIFSSWRDREQELVAANYRRITQRFVMRTNCIINQIERLTMNLFDVRITPILEVEPFTSRSKHYDPRRI